MFCSALISSLWFVRFTRASYQAAAGAGAIQDVLTRRCRYSVDRTAALLLQCRPTACCLSPMHQLSACSSRKFGYTSIRARCNRPLRSGSAAFPGWQVLTTTPHLSTVSPSLGQQQPTRCSTQKLGRTAPPPVRYVLAACGRSDSCPFRSRSKSRVGMSAELPNCPRQPLVLGAG